jgi:hypothetical protein
MGYTKVLCRNEDCINCEDGICQLDEIELEPAAWTSVGAPPEWLECASFEGKEAE